MRKIVIIAFILYCQSLIASDYTGLEDSFEKDFICINGGGYIGATNFGSLKVTQSSNLYSTSDLVLIYMKFIKKKKRYFGGNLGFYYNDHPDNPTYTGYSISGAFSDKRNNQISIGFIDLYGDNMRSTNPKTYNEQSIKFNSKGIIFKYGVVLVRPIGSTKTLFTVGLNGIFSFLNFRKLAVNNNIVQTFKGVDVKDRYFFHLGFELNFGFGRILNLHPNK